MHTIFNYIAFAYFIYPVITLICSIGILTIGVILIKRYVLDNKKHAHHITKRIYKIPYSIGKGEVSTPKHKTGIKQADDKRFILDFTYTNEVYLFLGILLIACWIFFFNREYKQIEEIIIYERESTINYPKPDYRFNRNILYRDLGEKKFRWYLIKNSTLGKYEFSFFTLIGWGGIFLIFCGLPFKKVYIFDRENGTITYPGFLRQKNITIPFKDAIFLLVRVGKYAVEKPNLALLHPNKITRTIINTDEPQKALSLYVWYMDKNRPLPPGTAFDAYRQKDHERRKQKGFPNPIYLSRVDTPDINNQLPDIYVGNINLLKRENKL